MNMKKFQPGEYESFGKKRIENIQEIEKHEQTKILKENIDNKNSVQKCNSNRNSLKEARKSNLQLKKREKALKREEEIVQKLKHPTLRGGMLIDQSLLEKFKNEKSNSIQNRPVRDSDFSINEFPLLGSNIKKIPAREDNPEIVQYAKEVNVSKENKNASALPNPTKQSAKIKKKGSTIEINIEKSIEDAILQRERKELNKLHPNKNKHPKIKPKHQTFPLYGNPLDSSTPIRTRGKQRNKRKKLSRMKNIILLERKSKKQTTEEYNNALEDSDEIFSSTRFEFESCSLDTNQNQKCNSNESFNDINNKINSIESNSCQNKNSLEIDKSNKDNPISNEAEIRIEGNTGNISIENLCEKIKHSSAFCSPFNDHLLECDIERNENFNVTSSSVSIHEGDINNHTEYLENKSIKAFKKISNYESKLNKESSEINDFNQNALEISTKMLNDNQHDSLEFPDVKECCIFSLEKEKNLEKSNCDTLCDSKNVIKSKELIHSRKFREYCDNLVTNELNEATENMIRRIVKFQTNLFERDPIKAFSKRRYVIGFREVLKFLSIKKLCLVVIAPDLEKIESEGGIYDTVNKIKCLSSSNGIPCIFSLGRRRLGYLTFKKSNVSCIGVLNFEGAEENFKSLMSAFQSAQSKYEECLKSLNSSN